MNGVASHGMLNHHFFYVFQWGHITMLVQTNLPCTSQDLNIIWLLMHHQLHTGEVRCSSSLSHHGTFNPPSTDLVHGNLPVAALLWACHIPTNQEVCSQIHRLSEIVVQALIPVLTLTGTHILVQEELAVEVEGFITGLVKAITIPGPW
jgi:hypothetical protein